jgi:Fe-S-cluster-containing hydrogenase component 2
MNKVHWNTVTLDGDVPEDELKRLIEHSYNLIKPKHRRMKMKLLVNKDKCPQNHKCPSIAVCPKGAISQKDIYSLPEIDGEKCVLCGKCMEYCPKGAFEKVEESAQ